MVIQDNFIKDFGINLEKANKESLKVIVHGAGYSVLKKHIVDSSNSTKRVIQMTETVNERSQNGFQDTTRQEAKTKVKDNVKIGSRKGKEKVKVNGTKVCHKW